MIVTIVKVEEDVNVHEKSYFDNDIEIKNVTMRCITLLGNTSNLNFLDVSSITHMNALFSMYTNARFNGNISEWDTSNVRSMAFMFFQSKFNQDISGWNVDNVEDNELIFQQSALGSSPQYQPKFKE